MFAIKWFAESRAAYERLMANAHARRKTRRAKSKRKSTRDEGLFKQVQKTIELLAQNPRHPGLNTHEYDSIVNPLDENQKVFEAYAQHRTPGAYGVFWCYGPGKREITIIAITPHP